MPASGLDRAICYVIDDDRDVRMATSLLLRSLGIEGRPFSSTEDFLDEFAHLNPGVVLLDLRMPGRDGLSILEEGVIQRNGWPIIVITGHGEVPVAVKAIKLGASDFLEKPFVDEDLRTALENAFEQLALTSATSRARAAAAGLLKTLTDRERTVFEAILKGKSNKAMALDLGLSTKTVEMHRANLMRRLGVRRLPELLSFASRAGANLPAAAAYNKPAEHVLFGRGL